MKTSPRHQQPRAGLSPRSGFSLVEVIIAMLILGIALVGLTQGITTALTSGKDSELLTTAALFAAGQIETVRADGYYTEGELEGECGVSLPLCRWRQTITPDELDGLHQISVIVEDVRTGKEVYELRTLLFKVPVEIAPTNQPTGGGATGGARR
jgi:prepilin-type N-terminal cleavage/methylation domain-containing protein